MSSRVAAKRKASSERKPAAAAPAAAAAASSVPKRRRAAPVGNMNEDALADAGMSALDDSAYQLGLKRSFWGQYDLALLVCWLKDFREYDRERLSDAELANREVVIERLSTRGWAIPPEEGDELHQLRSLWMQKTPKPERDQFGATVPGVFVPPAVSSSSAAAAPAPAPAAKPHSRSKIPVPRAFSAVEAMAIATPKKIRAEAVDFMVVSEDERGDEDFEVEPVGAVNPIPPPRRVDVGGRMFVVCPHCLELMDPRDPELFRCTKCFCRNDRPTSDPTNVFLVEQGNAARAAEIAAKHSQSSSSSSSAAATGQSADNASSLVLSRDKLLEKEFQARLDMMPVNPFFGKKAPVDPKHAIDENRKALGATGFARPTPKLLQLIREGKLTDVGYAIPTLIGNGASGAAKVTVENGSLSFAGTKGAPEVTSPLLFMQALCGTIIPALIDDPQAILQWATLGRTYLAVFNRGGGRMAHHYLEQYLNERIHSQKDFCEVSSTILTSVEQYAEKQAASGSGAAGPRAAVQSAGGSGRGVKVGGAVAGRTCHDYNDRGKCARGPSCQFGHTCSTCGGKHPRVNCTGAVASVAGSKAGGKTPSVVSDRKSKSADPKDGHDSE